MMMIEMMMYKDRRELQWDNAISMIHFHIQARYWEN